MKYQDGRYVQLELRRYTMMIIPLMILGIYIMMLTAFVISRGSILLFVASGLVAAWTIRCFF